METSSFFSPAIALWNQRQVLLNSRDRLQTLAEAVNWLNDLNFCGWGHWFTTTMEFNPDLIIELGRGHGNSTCVFTEAANQLGNCQVVSLCLTDIWQATTVPRFKDFVPPEWFRPLDAQIGNILAVDFKTLLEGKQRILILWDAHGFEVAGFVLGYLLPILQNRQHLVIMHDISDTRYIDPASMSYQNQGIWCGRSAEKERMVLGHFNSAVAQAVSILDFTSRNQLTLHSADHSFYTELSEDQINTLKQDLGSWFCQNGHWFWFSLNEKDLDQSIHFPAYSAPATEDSQRQVTLAETEKQHLQNQIEQLQNRIAAMESSKFWQLRSSWFAVKRAVGLKGE